MRLELSRRAQTDLDDIRDYSVEHWGLARAMRYFDAIETVFRRIVEHPRIGAAEPEFGDDRHSLPVAEHRLYYSVEADTVLIIRVLHKAMDAARHL